MIPISIVDNFLENPDIVRDFALALPYENSQGHFPGKRSTRIDLADKEFEKIISEKMFSLFFDLFREELSWIIEGSFQLISENFEKGWVHNDLSPDGWNMAGIIYLNPDPIPNSGTSFYRCKPDVNLNNIDLKDYNKIKHSFYAGNTVNLPEYRDKRDTLFSFFEKTLTVENIFNRLLIYSTDEFHSADNFFGTSNEDSRLTFMFQAKIKSQGSNPLNRSRQFII